MVKNLTLFVGYIIVLVGAALIHKFHLSLEQQSHPLTLLVFLLLLGAVEVYFLVISFSHYFHWFFYKKDTVVYEIKTIMLFYLFFLVVGVLLNQILQSSLFMILIALILPMAAGAIAFVKELVIHMIETHRR